MPLRRGEVRIASLPSSAKEMDSPYRSAFKRPAKPKRQPTSKKINRMLRLAGLSFRDIDKTVETPAGRGWKPLVYHCYSLFVFFVVSLLSLTQLLSVGAFWGDFQAVTINMCLFLMTIDKPIIVYLFVCKRQSLIDILTELDNVCSRAEKLTQSAKRRALRKPGFSKCIARLALVGSALTIGSWLLYPVVFDIDDKSVTFVFNAWYPYDTSRTPLRQIRLSLEVAGIVFQGTVGGGAYLLLYSLVNRWCQGMQALNAFTSAIGHRAGRGASSQDHVEESTCVLVRMGVLASDEEVEGSREGVKEAIEAIGWRGGVVLASVLQEDDDRRIGMTSEESVVVAVKVLEGMIRWLSNFQEVCNPLLFILYKTCRYVLSITAFQVALINDWNDPMLVKLSVTMVTAVIRLFFVCFIGEKLIKQTEELCVASYNCEWTASSKKTRSCLVMLLMRSQLPRHLLSGNTPLSLATFLTSINDSYSFYSMLRQFNDLF